MSAHTEAVYKNSCIKPSRIKTPEHFTCLAKQMKNLRISSADLDSNKNEQIKSFIEFYDSIPEYDDINHLSNKEFYKKMEYLRKRQRQFYASIMNEENSSSINDHAYCDNYKPLRDHSKEITIEKSEETISHKPPSRRSVRIESPEVLPKSSRSQVVSADSDNRCRNNRKVNINSMCDSTTLDELSDCTMTTRSVPCSPRKQTIAWDDNTSQSKPTEPFKMIVRNGENKIMDEEIIARKTHKSNDNGLFRANPVPIESRIPLFDKIMEKQERRSKQVKQKSKEALQAQMNLFSFTKREEEISDITRRLTKSSPDLFLCLSKEKKPKYFRAKPVPKNLFSNYAYKKMHEDQYYRSLQKKIRAEEMLKTASLPPAMAKREKSKTKYHFCPKSFREIYENQMRKISSPHRKDLEKELAELELDFILATPSPVHKSKAKCKRKQLKKPSSSSSSKSSRTTSTLESVNRSNLAAVLRIQTSRKRMEEEICRRLDEAQLREEARWREKVLRKRPVWQTLAYSHEEDLNMRLQMRRDEERMRNEEHRMQMECMLGRVNQQPTLFERQSNIKLAKAKEELVPPPSCDNLQKLNDIHAQHSNMELFKKQVEMKKEDIAELFADADENVPALREGKDNSDATPENE